MYKHRYSECSAECDKLTRECNDLRSEQQKFGAGPAKMVSEGIVLTNSSTGKKDVLLLIAFLVYSCSFNTSSP